MWVAVAERTLHPTRAEALDPYGDRKESRVATTLDPLMNVLFNPR
jgi:hypothetical protein